MFCNNIFISLKTFYRIAAQLLKGDFFLAMCSMGFCWFAKVKILGMVLMFPRRLLTYHMGERQLNHLHAVMLKHHIARQNII